MTTALTLVLVFALVPQVLFSAFYWRWFPDWVRHPYGRLAQLGSWCNIILLSLYLYFLEFGKDFNKITAGYIFILAFTPLVIFGFLQLYLLKKAIDFSKIEREEKVTDDN